MSRLAVPHARIAVRPAGHSADDHGVAPLDDRDGAGIAVTVLWAADGVLQFLAGITADRIGEGRVLLLAGLLPWRRESPSHCHIVSFHDGSCSPEQLLLA